MLLLHNTVSVWGYTCGMPAFPSTSCATPFIMTSKGMVALAIEKGLEQSFLLEPGRGQPGMRQLQFPLGLLLRSAGCRRGQHGWSRWHLAPDQGVQQPLMHSIAFLQRWEPALVPPPRTLPMPGHPAGPRH